MENTTVAQHSAPPEPRSQKPGWIIVRAKNHKPLGKVKLIKLVSLYDVDGFGVHRAVRAAGANGRARLGRGWSVSCLDTGMRVAHGANARRAIHAATSLITKAAQKKGLTPQTYLQELIDAHKQLIAGTPEGKVSPVMPETGTDAVQEGRAVVTLAIDKIIASPHTQPRAAVNTETVKEYAAEMQRGAQYPPVTVFYDGTDYWLADGYHRVNAATASGYTEIECEVRRGSREDAVWFSVGANTAHGLRRTNEDKKRAVVGALTHPKAAGMSDAAIAEHIGVSDRMVADYRRTTPKISESSLRMGRDGRTIDTRNIGKRSIADTPPPEESSDSDDDVSMAADVAQAVVWSRRNCLSRSRPPPLRWTRHLPIRPSRAIIPSSSG